MNARARRDPNSDAIARLGLLITSPFGLRHHEHAPADGPSGLGREASLERPDVRWARAKMALSRSRGPLVATRWRNDRATKELERARPAYFVGGTVTANRPWMQRLFVVALFAMAACGGRTSGSEANVDPASGVLTKTT